jgi:hypothetical protein
MNRLIWASVLAALMVGPMVPAARGQGAAIDQVGQSVDPDLLGWWTFDEEAGTVAWDSSGRGHDGRLCNGPVWVPGRLGPALQFDGIDDYVEVPHSAGLVPSGQEVTVAAWINAERYGGPNGAWWQGILAKDDAPRLYSLYTYIDGTLHFSTGPSYGSFVGTYSTGIVPLREWVHVAALVKDYHHEYYINGEPAGVSGANAVLVPGSIASLTIGRTHEADRCFLGMIDDVRLYDRALNAEEIKRMVQPSLQASLPYPPDGATGVIGTLLLRWTAGDMAVTHDVYFGTDEALVESADLSSPLYWGRQADARFSPAEPLQSGGRYWWRVDEVEADGTTIHKGPVWSFTAFNPSVIDDFENYTDQTGHRIREIWRDGFVNGTGAQVSRGSNPTGGGRAAAARGKQSMLLTYDNTWSPSISEVEREFVPPQDWTTDGADTLSLWFKGDAVSFGETVPGTFTMTAAGADIWSVHDEFRYAYKRLDGDGAMVVRVNSLARTDGWAKAGVMIRTSLDPAAAHAFMCVSGDGRRAFQNRPVNGSWDCFSAQSDPGEVTLPYWVKIEREGNQFTGYYSFDGIYWIRQANETGASDASPNPQTINMPSYVYVGLALSSHAAGVATTATFSRVEFTGDIIGTWQVADIGTDHPGNNPDDVYVAVEDSDGGRVAVTNPNPSAVNTTTWTEWELPLSRFAGVDLSRVKRMTIGVGGRESTIPPGKGRINIDDIRLSKQPAGSVLGICLVDTGELVLSDQDMAAYLRATHEIVLNESGVEKWNAHVVWGSSSDPPLPGAGGLYQKEFALRIDNREIYRGHFWSALSSMSCEGIVILDALLPCDGVHSTIQIENGYPGPSPGTEDPRDNAELLNFFAARGLLQ